MRKPFKPLVFRGEEAKLVAEAMKRSLESGKGAKLLKEISEKAPVFRANQKVPGIRKIVINKCVGGFGLSQKAYQELGLKWDKYGGGQQYGQRENRDDPKLVEVVEKLGNEANGEYAELKIVEIPDDVEWQIEEYDGAEWVAEKHRTWD